VKSCDKTALSVAGRFESLHPSLLLSGGLMRIFRAIVQIPMLAMFYAWQDLALGRRVALEFVGYDHAWYVDQFLEQLTKALLRRPLIPAALDKDIKDVPVLINRPPQVVTFSFNSQKYFIHMPFVARPRTPPTELSGILLAKFTTPFPNRFISYGHTTFEQELFDISEAEAEAKVQPHGVADDLGRKTVVFTARDWGYVGHAATLSHRLGIKQVVNTMAMDVLGTQLKQAA